MIMSLPNDVPFRKGFKKAFKGRRGEKVPEKCRRDFNQTAFQAIAEPIIDELNRQANEMNNHRQAAQQMRNPTSQEPATAMEQDRANAPPSGAAQTSNDYIHPYQTNHHTWHNELLPHWTPATPQAVKAHSNPVSPH